MPEEDLTPFNGQVLRVDHDAIMLWGTPFTWTRPHVLVKLMNQTSRVCRFRLHCSDTQIGVHVDVHRTLFAEALKSREPFEAELTFGHLLVAFGDQCYLRTKFPLVTFVPFAPRRSPRRLTLHQEYALSWMTRLEASPPQPFHMGLAVPHTDFVFVFCNTTHMFKQHNSIMPQVVPITAGVLGGARRSGKTRVVRRLLETCPGALRSQLATTYMLPQSCLIVVPSHLLQHWEQELKGMRNVHILTTKEETLAWRASVAATHTVVVVSYTNMRLLFRQSRNMHKSKVGVHAAIRKQIAERTLDVMHWTRVVLDELNDQKGGVKTLVQNLRYSFCWVMQGELDGFEAQQLVQQLYPGAMGQHLCPGAVGQLCTSVAYHGLPSLPLSYTPIFRTVTLTLQGMELQMYKMFVEYMDNSSWLLANDFDELNMTVVSSWEDAATKGREVLQGLQNMESLEWEENSTDEWWETQDWIDHDAIMMEEDEEDEEDENNVQMRMNTMGEVQIRYLPQMDPAAATAEMSNTFFENTLKQLHDGVSFTCSVCWESGCDVVFVCGHVFCANCAFTLMNQDDQTNCPTCRFELTADRVFWNRQPTSDSVFLEWLRTLEPKPTLVVANAATCDLPLPPHMKFVQVNQLNGLTVRGVNTFVCLDDVDPVCTVATEEVVTFFKVTMCVSPDGE